MTISLVVILFELTGALSHVLPIMIAVMTAKWVGDAQGTDGIYSVWIAMRQYPWLPPVDFKDTQAVTGENIMKSADRLVKIEEGNVTVADLGKMLARYGYSGFPVVNGQELVGYASRTKLQALLDALPRSPSPASKICSFSPPNRQTTSPSSPQPEYNIENDAAITTPPSVNKTLSSNSLHSSPEIIDIPEMTATPTTPQPTENPGVEDTTDFSSALDSTTLQLRKQVPREVIVTMFQKMNLREVLLTEDGRLEGMVTKRDITRLLTSHFDHAAALTVSPSSG